MSCTPRNTVKGMLRNIAKDVEIDRNTDKETRVNVWEITDKKVMDMFESFSSKDVQVDSKRIKGKLDRSLDVAEKFRPAMQTFVKSLQTVTVNGVQTTSDKSARHQAIALKDIMDSIKGEIDKAGNENVNINDISNDGVNPYIPLHRLAATIGRKILYLEGYRFKKISDSKGSAVDVERAYYRSGMVAINNLQDNGFISVHEGRGSIKDYLDDISSKRNYSEKVTTEVSVVELNLKAFDVTAKSSAKKYFTDKSIIDINNHPLSAYVKVIESINYVSQPSNITLPSTSPIKERKNQDAYTLTPEMEAARKELESNPVFIDSDLHSFFDLLHKELKDSDMSASKWISNHIKDTETLKNLFKVEKINIVLADQSSHVGRNLSKTTPVDDLIEYYDHMTDANGKAASLYMPMFGGKNARLYYENSVVNPQASKLMRHALTISEYEMSVGSEVYNFYVNKVALRLGLTDFEGNSTPEVLLDSDNVTEEGKTLTKAFEMYDKFVSKDTAAGKLKQLTQLQGLFPHLDFADIVTTVRAAKGIRDSLGSKTIKTSYMVSSDATASGGQLILKQALGTNPSSIKKLMQRLGLLDGEVDTQDKLKDIYGILKVKLENFVNNITDLDDFYVRENENNDKIKKIVDLVSKDLYNGDIRELSKGPTMTFIYQQSEEGANNSLSNTFSGLLVANLNKIKVSSDTIDLVNELLGTDHKNNQQGRDALRDDRNIKDELRKAFASSGMPSFLFDTLTDSLVTEYLATYRKRSEQVFKFLNNNPLLSKMRMYPAAAVVEAFNGGKALSYTKEHLKDFGLPLTKVFEVQNTVDGETVLTREDKLQPTVLGVSQVHGVDTSNQYRGIAGLPTKHETGSISIHDDTRTSAPALMEFEGQYVEQDFNAAFDFDIHEQALMAALAYDPSLKKDSDFVSLLDTIRKEKSVKQEILEESRGFKTLSVIGDGLVPTSIVKPKPKPKKSFKDSSLSETDILEDLASESAVISKFLTENNSSTVIKGSQNKFDTDNDTIVISDKDDRTGGSVQSIKTAKGRKNLIELIEHEITHSYTIGLISDWAINRSNNVKSTSPQLDLNLAYISKSMNRLRDNIDSGRIVLDNTTINRLKYALDNTGGEATRLAEFIAIMNSESEVAKKVYKALGDSNKSRLKKVIAFVKAKVKEMLSSVSYRDVVTNDVDAGKLYTAINSVIAEGTSERETNIANIKAIQTWYGKDLFAASPINSDGISGAVELMNASIARRINDPLVNKSGEGIKWVDDFMRTNFPLYATTLDKIKGIYDSSEALQGIIHKITNSNVNTDLKNKVLSLAAATRSGREDLTSKELQKFNKLKLSDVEKTDLYDFTSKMAIQDYFLFAEGVTDFDAEVKALEVLFDTPQLRKMETIVELNVNDKVYTDTIYNVNALSVQDNLKSSARKLVVLKSILAIEDGPQRFTKLMSNTAMADLVKDVVVANELILTEGRIPKLDMRDSQMTDQYKEQTVFKVVNQEQVNNYAYEEKSGWKVLKSPTKNSLGVVYKQVIDSTFIEGAFTDIRTQSTDIVVGKEMRHDPRVVKIGDKYKYILETKYKNEIGLVKDASQGLVRTMAHNMAILDTHIIRDLIMEETNYWNLGSKGTDNLSDLIKDKNRDHPWFIGGNEDIKFSDLPKEVQAAYMPKSKKLSNVKSSNGKGTLESRVQYVRKDINYWLVGATESSIATDPKLKWALRITKSFVTGAKISMVILNPAKIAADNMSNLSYLSVMGVDPLEIQKSYRLISSEFDGYQKIKNELTQLRVRGYARPDDKSLQKKIKLLNDKLKAHPSNGLVTRGFINSLGSELIVNANDPSSGFKKDLDSVLKTIFQDNKGKNNDIGKFIMNFSRWNVGLEEFLETLSPVFGSLDSTKNVETELNRIAKRLKDIKSEDDLISYLHQYLNSPDSEFVKLGSHMTDLTDILAKETYYRHLVGVKDMDPKKAELEVTDSFPDYKEVLPLKIKQLSDVGIIPFPNYGLRIQKAIYRMVKNKPVSFGTELAIENYFNLNAQQIWDSNVWNMHTSFTGIFQNPWNYIGMKSII